ncbi:MAG: diguanylate cyclase, partial [Firmicutes bacterium]|nr:diguanylate cyclase [Bacillota bacterium]
AAYHIVSESEKYAVMAAAQKIGENICERVRKTYEYDGKKVTVSASVGVSLYSKCGTDYGSLYRSADKALYNVKDKGKNNYEIYDKQTEVAK